MVRIDIARVYFSIPEHIVCKYNINNDFYFENVLVACMILLNVFARRVKPQTVTDRANAQWAVQQLFERRA